MTICQFYLRGQCKFGNTCKNEHPAQRPGSFAIGGQARSGNGGVAISYTHEGLSKDFTPGAEKPMWPLSSYGSAKMEPTIFANLDESPEELRVKAVQALKAGSLAEYQKYEAEKIQVADQTYAKARSEVNQIYDHASNLTTSMHNGIPITIEVAYNSPANTASPSFGKPAPSAFGGTSAFGSTTTATPSAFGAVNTAPTSVFGSSTTATPSAFVKPAFGQSAFGQPAFGQSAFGQPSKPVSAFGQPSQTTSAFGQPSQTTSAFGQAAQSKPSTSAFGGALQQQSTSAFGQTSQPQSSFIKPATGFGGTTGGAFSAFSGGGASAFGAGAQQGPAPAFGQSAFGGNAGAAPSTSAFGNAAQSTSAPSAFGASPSTNATQQTTSAFGLPAKPVSAFGQSPQTTSAFGQPSKPVSAFGQAAQPTPSFGQTSQPSAFGQTSQPSAFGQTAQPSAFGQTAQPSAFGQTSQPSAFGQTAQPSAFGQASQSTSAFAATPATTSAFGGAAAGLPAKPKSSAPDFAAALATIRAQPGRDKHDAILPPDYADRIPVSAKEAFAAPRFEWGNIPEWIPPIELR